MRNRQFQRLRQKHRNAVAARKAIGFQHIGEAAGEVADVVERMPRRAAVLVDIDQRQPVGAIGVAVAARGRDVEPHWDIPAEAAVEVVVIGGFGEHGRWPSNFSPPASAAFTMPLALPKSICPAYFAFSAAITLPMSFIPAALVSAIAAAIAALTSSSDICFGR